MADCWEKGAFAAQPPNETAARGWSQSGALERNSYARVEPEPSFGTEQLREGRPEQGSGTKQLREIIFILG